MVDIGTAWFRDVESGQGWKLHVIPGAAARVALSVVQQSAGPQMSTRTVWLLVVLFGVLQNVIADGASADDII